MMHTLYSHSGQGIRAGSSREAPCLPACLLVAGTEGAQQPGGATEATDDAPARHGGRVEQRAACGALRQLSPFHGAERRREQAA
eukprot:1878384-Prymnesium_polylepis.1